MVPTGPCSSCAYFLDNSLNTYTTAYDAMTTVLTAVAANIQPGQTYHLKLATSDVGDHIFDTGVFLEAGSFRIAGPPALFVGGNRLTGTTVHICQGSSVSLSAPAGFSYLWNNGATTQAIDVSTAGTYNVTITGFNINYTVVSPPVTFIVDMITIPNPVLTFANNTISSSVNSTSYNYSWTYNGMPVAGATTFTIPASQSGCYAVTIQDPGGCFVTSDTLCVIPLGINEINADQHTRLYPNPAHDKITMSIDLNKNTDLSLQLSDFAGRVIMSQKQSARAGTNNYEINLAEFAKGIYMLTILSADESRKMKMVIE
ncbi:MAG: T9SS type A sorting domain-containing protein [Bacteroidia bacterium]